MASEGVFGIQRGITLLLARSGAARRRHGRSARYRRPDHRCATGAGLSTGGRSAFFQLALLAFGLHSVVHLLQSALLRGYTPGVVTAILVVAPYPWWAWLQIRHARIVNDGGASWASAIALFAVVVLGARLIALLVSRLRPAPNR
jgi:Protein of unknown function with HXXEE motif